MRRDDHECELRAVMATADAMMAAARTAPKAHGYNNLETFVLDGDEKKALTDAMRAYGKESKQDFIIRDAGNIDMAQAIVMFGAIDEFYGLNCAYCGAKDCALAGKEERRCAFSVIDMGIAVGSAVSIAADNRVDSRVMYSAGTVAIMAGLFKENVKVALGVPISVTHKSIFFDRK